MPLFGRSKNDKLTSSNLNNELPPSPPTSEAPSSINSGAGRNNLKRDENGNTVTTTTTTTTTTVTGGSHSQSNPTVNGSTVSSNDSGYQSQRSAGNIGEERKNGGYDAPNVPQRHEMRDYQQSNAAGSGPSNPNFSRPMGTTDGIKAAMHGIHGAGEVLRGTLNSAVDRTMNQPPEVVAQNQAIASNGRQEISNQPGNRMAHHVRRRSGNAGSLPAVDERTRIL
ncbi:hypothetical protein MMC17_008861 [Xylographa soralifera]|nr:hypothetical protein [Xylographa soralifera]